MSHKLYVTWFNICLTLELKRTEGIGHFVNAISWIMTPTSNPALAIAISPGQSLPAGPLLSIDSLYSSKHTRALNDISHSVKSQILSNFQMCSYLQLFVCLWQIKIIHVFRLSLHWSFRSHSSTQPLSSWKFCQRFITYIYFISFVYVTII